MPSQVPDSQAIQEFKASLRGDVLQPGDADYEDCRKVFNAMIDKRPLIMARCAGAADIIRSVRFARSQQLPVAVRGVGHNVAGTSVCDEGIVIDLSRMKGIRVDPGARTARVEPGVTWGELNDDLQIFGLAATGGFVSTTGVSGLTVGGGLGWLVRKHGLALDNLLSADVVIADGTLLTASASQNQDLFWGIRGGGGNFGIIASFEFQVHPVDTVLAGLVLHPAATGSEALRYWRAFEAGAPEELTSGVVIFQAPPELPLPPALKDTPIVGMGGVYAGAMEAAERTLRPLRDFGPPEADLFQSMPYSAAQKMADFLWPRGRYNYWKSSYLRDLSDGAIQVILAFVDTVPSKHTVVVLEHNGDGAMSRVPEDETSFGGRQWPYNFLVTSAWTDAAESDRNIRWTRAFWEAMQPYLADAAYVNYLGGEEQERVRSSYGAAKYEQLARLKQKYDPANLFRLNQNIRPAA